MSAVKRRIRPSKTKTPQTQPEYARRTALPPELRPPPELLNSNLGSVPNFVKAPACHVVALLGYTDNPLACCNMQ